MSMITSFLLTIADGPASGSVVVGVHGTLDVPAAARLQRVLDSLLEDKEILAISVDLRHVYGAEFDGMSGLTAAAERASQRSVELTLRDPPELLCQALESDGLTGLIRMVHQVHEDGRLPWRASEADRSQARSRHPSGHPSAVDDPDVHEA